jgi:hypothetical protein
MTTDGGTAVLSTPSFSANGTVGLEFNYGGATGGNVGNISRIIGETGVGGGGSIRGHEPQILESVFEVMGYEKEKIPGVLEFTSEAPGKIIAKYRKKGVKQALLVGGGEINSLFLEKKLISEIIIQSINVGSAKLGLRIGKDNLYRNFKKFGFLILTLAAIEFLSYVMVKVIGEKKGLLVVGFLGGFVSSTAVLVTSARSAAKFPKNWRSQICSALAAKLAAMIELLLIVFLLSPALILNLALQVGAGLLVGALVLAYFARGKSEDSKQVNIKSPLD